MSRDPSPGDWQHAEVIFNRDEAERSAVLSHLADGFQKISELIRWSGTGVLVTTVFEKTAARPWAILLLNPSLDQPFSVIMYADKIAFSREVGLQIGDGVSTLDLAGVTFYRTFVEKLGKSLAATPATGPSH
ncbi:MAG: hypothetical protein WA733_10375 [Methylocystis sp.]